MAHSVITMPAYYVVSASCTPTLATVGTVCLLTDAQSKGRRVARRVRTVTGRAVYHHQQRIACKPFADDVLSKGVLLDSLEQPAVSRLRNVPCVPALHMRCYRSSLSCLICDRHFGAGQLVCSGGCIVIANGMEVLRTNLPAAPAAVPYHTLVERGEASTPAVSTGFTIPDSALIDGINSIAVEVRRGEGTEASSKVGVFVCVWSTLTRLLR